MLENSELNIRFHPGWIDEHKKHFLSQLMLIETKKRQVIGSALQKARKIIN